MSAEYLRETARMMREVANGVTEEDRAAGRWEAIPRLDADNDGWVVAHSPSHADYDTTIAECIYDYEGGTARHFAAWPPIVALAVAESLSFAAEVWTDDRCHSPIGPDEMCGECDRCDRYWLQQRTVSVARAYRGDA